MEPTRETFGNIPGWSQVLFYVLAVVTAAVFAFGVWRRYRLWSRGRPMGWRLADWRSWAAKWRPGWRRLLVDGAGQRRVSDRGWAGRAHVAFFAGFMMLLLGTTLLEINHIAELISRNLSFHRGSYYVAYELTLDVFGILFLAGCGFFLVRRLRLPPSAGHRASDWWVLGTFIAIGVTGYLVEALRIVWQRPEGIAAHCSPVGLWLARQFFAGLTEPAARSAHLAVWWLHAVLVFAFLAAIPFTRLFHFIAGPLNLVFRPGAVGAMEPVDMATVEATGRMGAGAITDLSRQQLLSLDACMECGRCEEACPAFATAKPLSPKKVVQDLKGEMELALRSARPTSARRLPGEVIVEEALWACTSCNACVAVCPVHVDQLTLILEMRRNLVAEGGLSGTAATALRRMQSAANPWGLPAADRAGWRDTLPT
jgi:heterodisulfide reductase subunit C/nitrate reductase gamma subunit